MAVDSEDGGGNDIDQAILVHSKKIYSHMLIAALLLFVFIGATLGGLLSMASMMEKTEALLAIKPENRADTLAKKIASATKKAEADYAALAAKMENDDIYVINRMFKVMYEQSASNERDYSRMLGAYQQASFNIASAIRGSGEWYFYYERDLKALLKTQLDHEEKLSRYLATLQ